MFNNQDIAVKQLCLNFTIAY